MIAHWTHAGLCEAIGWGVAWAALLVLTARAVVDGPEYLGGWLHRAARWGRRAARVLAAYARTRSAEMRRPHRHRARRPHPRLAATVLAARLAMTRFTIPGGTR